MSSKHLGLVCSFALIAVASANWFPHHWQTPTKVEYLNAGISVALDAGYFTNNTGISLQYTNNTASLNWETTLVKEIGNKYEVRVIVEKKIGHHLWIRKYDSGRRSFCSNVPDLLNSYVDMIGFYAANPPVTSCPFAPGTYKLNNFNLDVSLDRHVERGQLAISYGFFEDRKMVISLSAEVIVS